MKTQTKIKLISKKKFDELSIRQKRVAIAKDVLARIKNKLINAQTGYFMQSTTFAYFTHQMDSKGAQKVFNTKKCEVCAKGALVCAWVGNFNHYSGRDIVNFDEYVRPFKYPDELVKIFGHKMLAAIETAFENRELSWNKKEEMGDNRLSEKEMSDLLYKSAGKYEGRLDEIMNNIIENKGKFVVGNMVFV